MNSTYAAFIIPAFFTFVFLEYWITKRKRLPVSRSYDNAVSNISIGIAERLLNLFITGSFFSFYMYLYEHYAVITFTNHWYTWVLLLLATDFIWYWYHRYGHEINIMWGAHVVHHQSEEFNYTVSARITTLQAIIRNLFWAILPVLGFHPLAVTTILVVHGTYSFFTHTETIGKLGWLEYFLVTPSHHRVHHASNEKYLNKNYGDIFIIWDKLFGTYQAEEEKPAYGLTHPLKSHSFLWQHFHYYVELWEACRRSGSVAGSLKILFGRPEDVDENIRIDLEKKFRSPHILENSTRSFQFRFYLTLQIALASLGVVFFTWFFSGFSFIERSLTISIVLLTLIICGAMLEQKRWIFYLEIIRSMLTSLFLSYEMESPLLLLFLAVLIALIALSETAERYYYKIVYNYGS